MGRKLRGGVEQAWTEKTRGLGVDSDSVIWCVSLGNHPRVVGASFTCKTIPTLMLL